MKHLPVVFTLLLTMSAQVPAGGTGDHDHAEGSHGPADGDSHAHKFAVGEPANPDQAHRVLRVSMLDSMRFVFDPPLDSIRGGEIIRFVVTNKGQIPHEFSIGDRAEQEQHRKMMRAMPNMKHADPNTITVEPGMSGELVWKFAGKGEVVFACNIPGHFEAGMHHGATITENAGAHTPDNQHSGHEH